MTRIARLMKLHRLMAPADEGADLGGAEDYGDDFTPTQGTRGTPDEGGGSADADDPNDREAVQGDGIDEGLRKVAEEHLEGGEKPADTGTPAKKGKFIPLERHEKMLRKERARREELEAQLSQSKAGREMAESHEAASKVEDQLVEMESKYNELLAEGDVRGAAQVMTQIRRENAKLQDVQNRAREAEVLARAVEKVRFDEAVERIEAAYPVLDPEHDDFDEDVAQDVTDLMNAGLRRGLSATKALQRAVARVLGADTAAQGRATTATPRVNEDQVAQERSTQARRRNLDAARRQPAPTHKAGAGNDAAGGALTTDVVMRMSEAEFDKLSERDLARLRGDEF